MESLNKIKIDVKDDGNCGPMAAFIVMLNDDRYREKLQDKIDSSTESGTILKDFLNNNNSEYPKKDSKEILAIRDVCFDILSTEVRENYCSQEILNYNIMDNLQKELTSVVPNSTKMFAAIRAGIVNDVNDVNLANMDDSKLKEFLEYDTNRESIHQSYKDTLTLKDFERYMKQPEVFWDDVTMQILVSKRLVEQQAADHFVIKANKDNIEEIFKKCPFLMDVTYNIENHREICDLQLAQKIPKQYQEESKVAVQDEEAPDGFVDLGAEAKKLQEDEVIVKKAGFQIKDGYIPTTALNKKGRGLGS